MSLAIIAEVASAVMIIFHGLALVGLLPLSAKLAKGFAGLIWFTLTAGFLIGGLAANVESVRRAVPRRFGLVTVGLARSGRQECVRPRPRLEAAALCSRIEGVSYAANSSGVCVSNSATGTVAANPGGGNFTREMSTSSPLSASGTCWSSLTLALIR